MGSSGPEGEEWYDAALAGFRKNDQDPPQFWPTPITKEPNEPLAASLPVLSFIHQHLQSWLSLTRWWRAHAEEHIQQGIIGHAQVVERLKWEAVTSPVVIGKLLVEGFNETVPWSGDSEVLDQASVPTLDIPSIERLPAARDMHSLHRKFAERVAHRGCVKKISRRLEFHRREWLCLCILQRYLDRRFPEITDNLRVICKFLPIQPLTSLHGFRRKCLLPLSCGWETEPATLGVRDPCPHCSSETLNGPRHLRFSSGYTDLPNAGRLREDHCLGLLQITSQTHVTHVVLKHILSRRLAGKCLTCDRRLGRPGWYCCLSCPNSSVWNRQGHCPGKATKHTASCSTRSARSSEDRNRPLRWCPFQCARVPPSLLTQGQATVWWEVGRSVLMRDMSWDLGLLGHETEVLAREQSGVRTPYITGRAPNNMNYEILFAGSGDFDHQGMVHRGMVLRARSGWRRCDGYDFFLAMVFARMQSLRKHVEDVD